ncbi:DNA repair protein [Verruconis gallopava]|uniref:DNA repair protein RAD14 n=1 Tax=Verruconis gallopava TaxID=253628 RepID=A0A0D2AR76_9PEZI|nr:DNA repair protein [Verruconis gallopava]KIW09213.1 DNA repair protein [Verruconis gallopava]
MAERPSTPPRAAHSGDLPPNPLTPEQVRRTEEARLRAKARRAQHDAERPPPLQAGQKRPHSLISGAKATPDNVRNAAMQAPANDAPIRPAKKFEKNAYIEYDFSKMTDTKGGFLSDLDDPDRARQREGGPDPLAGKPVGMTAKEWERTQLLKKLRAARAGPFEPGISVLEKEREKVCRECGSLEIDFQWADIFGCCVCHACKDKYPDRYSLLTKTEAREDYLLTNPELEDKELLPRMEKPNPHKSHWSTMQLYLRYQVEDFAFSDKKWGSPAALDAEFERREAARKAKKEAKFRTKLNELKKRTRVDAFERSVARRNGEDAGADVKFGDKIVRKGDRHEHEWGNTVEDPETGIGVKRCIECGMQCEEIEL